MNLCFVVIGIIIFVFILYGYGSNYACKVTRQTIFLDCSQDGFSRFKFVVLSDLHGKSFGKRNHRLLKKIRENNPDAILIPGDLIVKNGKGKDVGLDLLRRLGRDYPVFYAPGNHEIRMQGEEEFREAVKRTGVNYLENEHVSFQTPQGGKVRVYGLSLEKDYYKKFWEKSALKEELLFRYLGKPEGKRINILLAHNPEFFHQYANWGADVVVSGHLHGGVMSLGSFGVIAPSLRLFPRYCKGYYQKNNAHLYVSRGLGLHHIKLRFFNLPELAVISLVSSSEE